MRTEYDYTGKYRDLYLDCERLIKRIESCEVHIIGENKHIFFEKVVTAGEAGDSAYVARYVNIKQCFTGEILNLESRIMELERKYKAEYNVEKEYKDIIVITKELKEKVSKNSKGIEILKNKKEIAETKADLAESKVEKERKERQNTEEKTKRLAQLLRQVQSEEISMDALKHVNIEDYGSNGATLL